MKIEKTTFNGTHLSIKSRLSADARSLQQIAAILVDFLRPPRTPSPIKVSSIKIGSFLDLEVESVLEVNGHHQREDQQFLRCFLLALGEKGFTSDSGSLHNQLLRRAVVLLTIIRKESSECS